MNAVNRIATSIFDVLLTPFELLGSEWALILVSGIIGILALICFKFISWQKGIKAAKDKIKGNMIAIRIYQDDLGIVGKSVGNVLLRNFQYIGLNFGPIVPLCIPFALVLAQFVVRYGFDPLPVVETEEEVAGLLPGQGTLIDVTMREGAESQVLGLELRLPPWIRAISPLARSEGEGLASIEVVAVGAGQGEIEVLIDGKPVGTKEIVAGTEPTRVMQPERVSSFWSSWLWPAEDTFAAESPVAHVKFEYPDSELGFLPGGVGGVILVFLVASLLFGVLVLKPLNIQI